ncbi:uncharacterized protein LOC133901487 [Phragmites australis]|uniref:uncharacterized protein LOC133901487 n=1 Tax=Phragmites australis TaxID=29695 RepID=UPI002D7A0B8F|nr:uncharacterized protein LOC133901487 [Phragmites australis]
MEGKYQLVCLEQYDCIIFVELLDKHKYPKKYKMIVKHMMHGPCGVLNSWCPCTKDHGSCKNHYLRLFNVDTMQGKDPYPTYRRRDDDRHVTVQKYQLDNMWVIPYNSYLLRLFNYHINVEVCSSIKVVKYMFKYIYKGHDRVSVSVNEANNNGIDEIKQYREEVLDRDDAMKSMLTEYFESNRVHEQARDILYRDFPEWFTWQTRNNRQFWKVSKCDRQVGRIVMAHPTEGERYFLRVLLNHVTDAITYEDLRIIDGKILPSFCDVAERKGMIEVDNTLDECLTEAELFQMPSSLQRLFATILVFYEPNDVRGLWNRHLEAMSDDYRRINQYAHMVEQKVLIDVRNMLQTMGKDIRSFPLPDIDEALDMANSVPREIFEESMISVDHEHTTLSDSLNIEQRVVYNEILAVVNSGEG